MTVKYTTIVLFYILNIKKIWHLLIFGNFKMLTLRTHKSYMREEFEFFYMFILKRIRNLNLNKNSNYINLNVSWELIVFFLMFIV